MTKVFDAKVRVGPDGKEEAICPVCSEGTVYLEEYENKGIVVCWTCEPESYFDIIRRDVDTVQLLVVDYVLEEEPERWEPWRGS